ncbi:cysteine desulfurase [Candidatus Nomurabacteria bacterium]|nr:cysteine desulfurase [Candidatus Nomurabacteria bacterium]
MVSKKEIYLDYAASALPNPSSIHVSGINAKKKLEEARKIVARVLGARTSEIIFTSGATESNNLAIQGVVFAVTDRNFLPHIITTNIEHPSVLETFKLLEKRKFAEISIIPVETNGIVNPKKIKKEIRKNTVLISVMYANNEIGTIQPIKEISKVVRFYNKTNSNKVFFHTDATQAVSYLDLNVERLGVDLLSLSGAKIEGAGRVGVLHKRASVQLANVFGGGDQEMGLRPGTENLPEIVKFAQALKMAQDLKEKEVKRLTTLRNYFLDQLSHSNILTNFGMTINGDLENRLPNNVNVTFPKIPSDLIVVELSAKGIMTSSKSACKSGEAGGSYVIKAICKKPNRNIGGIRFSLGRDTKKSDIDYTVKSLSEILQKLKKWYNV